MGECVVQGESHLTELWRVTEMLIPLHTYLSKLGRLHTLNEGLVSYTTIKRFFIHQCLSCCLIYRVIVTIFLNSIYMR